MLTCKMDAMLRHPGSRVSEQLGKSLQRNAVEHRPRAEGVTHPVELCVIRYACAFPGAFHPMCQRALVPRSQPVREEHPITFGPLLSMTKELHHNGVQRNESRFWCPLSS